MSATPADAVKKRRRTASWKVGANGPTIVAVADVAGEKRYRKKNNRNCTDKVTDNMEQEAEFVDRENDHSTSCLSYSNDMSLEKLVASWKDGITGIDQDFKDVYEFRDVLQKYAIAHHFVYKLKKNDINRASGRCVVEGCSWRIHASWVPATQSFRIKKFNGLHTCNGKSWQSAHPAKNWLVNMIKEKLRDSPHCRPKEIANSILQDFGIALNYTQVWRGIEDAREQLQGSYKDAYNLLPWICEKIVETNPGSFAKLVTGHDKRFRCIFICFGASIQGFLKGCRPLFFLESTSLKSKYQETLLIAMALDGDDGLFPVAFAIVDNESHDNWHWFLEQLKSAVPVAGPLTFVSDREKRLRESVIKVFETARYGYSMYHLLESLKRCSKGPFHGDGRGSLHGNFVAAAYAVRLVGFRKFTEQIKQVSSDVYNWVMQIEPEYWTTASFKGERYNHITQNLAEPYIKMAEEVRELPITQKIEALRQMIMELLSTHRADSNNWSTKLTPSKEEKLREEVLDARGLKVLISSDTIFEVHDDANHVVNLDKWNCTCLKWQTTGLPCCHAIAVFNCKGRNVYDYCSRFFKVDTFRLTYSESVNPIPGIDKPAERKEEAADETADVLPPCPSRSLDQLKATETKTQRAATRSVTCAKCKEIGHNKATCKANL